MRRSIRRVASTAASPARAASASAPAAGTSAWPVSVVTLAGSGLGATVSTWAQPCRTASSTRAAPTAPSSSNSASSRRGSRRAARAGSPAVICGSSVLPSASGAPSPPAAPSRHFPVIAFGEWAPRPA